MKTRRVRRWLRPLRTQRRRSRWTVGPDGRIHFADGRVRPAIQGGQDLGDLGLWDPGMPDLSGVATPDTSLPNLSLSGMFGSGAGAPGTGGPDQQGGAGSLLSTISGYAKEALPLLQLGTTALGGYSGIRGMQYAGQQQRALQGAQKTQQAAAAPLLAAGQTLTPAGTQAVMGGPLPPQLETVVQAWTQGHKAQLRQQLASMGIQDSTMIEQAETAIDQSAMLLRAQLAQGLLQSGEQAALGSAQAVGGVEQSAAGQQTQVAQAIGAANAALAQMLGRT